MCLWKKVYQSMNSFAPLKQEVTSNSTYPESLISGDINFFVLCGVNGFAYNFEIYTGEEHKCEEGELDFGAAANVVILLSRIIPTHVYHKVYFDNYYTSVPLVSYME